MRDTERWERYIQAEAKQVITLLGSRYQRSRLLAILRQAVMLLEREAGV